MSHLAENMMLDPVALQRTMRAVRQLAERDVTALTLDELRAIVGASHDLSRHAFGEEWRRTHAPRRTRMVRRLRRARVISRGAAWRRRHRAGPGPLFMLLERFARVCKLERACPQRDDRARRVRRWSA